jgi:hypothetical protein
MSDKAYRPECVVPRAQHRIDPSRELPNSECWMDDSGQSLMNPDVLATGMLRGNAAAQEQLAQGAPTSLTQAGLMAGQAGQKLADWREQMDLVTRELEAAYEIAREVHVGVASKLGVEGLVGEQALSVFLTFLGAAFGNAVKVSAAARLTGSGGADMAAGLGTLGKSAAGGLSPNAESLAGGHIDPAADVHAARGEAVDAGVWLQSYSSSVGQQELPSSNPIQLLSGVLPAVPELSAKIAEEVELELWKGWMKTSGWTTQYNAYSRSHSAVSRMPDERLFDIWANPLRTRLTALGVDANAFFAEYAKESCEQAQEQVSRANWSLGGPDFDECE